MRRRASRSLISSVGGVVGLLGRIREASNSRRAAAPQRRNVSAHLLTGHDDLEVVGELSYQGALWQLSGGAAGDKIRCDAVAVLVPEPTNPHDPNAIAVHIGGYLVGYLPRGVAQEYLPGLRHLMSRLEGYIALRGVIVGGGYYADGPGRLGVWLEHDPADFGIAPAHLTRSQPPNTVNAHGVMRTGFSEAWLTDAEDDSYDLSWFNQLPEADRPAIAMLRELLATDPDPIDRHFQFCELETRLYRSRELYASALAEYDQACQLHDAEMQQICAAFMAKWGKIPLLDTYRQMAVRQQKKKDWRACQWWAERGLALYADHGAREEAVEDLIKRRNRAVVKLATTAEPTRHMRQDAAAMEAQLQSRSNPANLHPAGDLEILTCQQCAGQFERMRVRGRKPTLCPACRTTATQ
jgi:hypothetical protein